MGDIKLCRMDIDDIPEIMVIENLSFAVPWSAESFITEVQNNRAARYVVAKDTDKVIGYGGMWIILDESHITNIAVHPDYRGKGIGNLILKAMIEMAKQENIIAMTLEVRRTNYIAQRLYEKYGFVSVGIRPKYYEDNNEDAIIMWKNNV
ncbi:mycothiol acetyltransferase [Oxobacter pfennigii]|uniref:[Ribosomal protein bS18]-alanine N-acetyltransferase n=1 Tax=Oxobacter pfennigii TaxID=36849 RepID=A0A0P8WYW9_9CLOT|nr:ribosomal protein S18-alanine N-acetyltransferase [Oxobacter pfennigii]KPU43625.1 mycothiol acetyltransferase [Oxobacter pfennigii]